MNSTEDHSTEQKMLNELHSDCRSWRRVASACASAAFIPPSTDEQYRVVHGRILTRCRNLAAEEWVAESRRHIAMQLDELLRPWPSASLLKEAPPKIVDDLVKSQAILDERLSGRRRHLPRGPFGRWIFTAALAAAGGILIVLFLQWANTASQLQPLQGWVASVAAYVGQTSFTERFAVAILVSWLFGTWLLSRLSTN